MFPEYRDLISQLKQSDKRFARLFDEHNELDEKIANLAKNPIRPKKRRLPENAARQDFCAAGVFR